MFPPGRFEAETPSTQRNLTALMNLSDQWIDQAHGRRVLLPVIERYRHLDIPTFTRKDSPKGRRIKRDSED